MTLLNPSLVRTLLLAMFALACAFPAQAAEPPRCKYVKIGDLPLSYTGPHLEPIVEGSINRQAASMLVDTGAYASFVTSRGADRFKLTQRITGRSVSGTGGATRLYGVRLKEFGVGPSHTSDLYLDVIADSAPFEFDAILGADFLFQADLEISLAEHAVRFFRGVNCADTFLAYWVDDAVVVPLNPAATGTSNLTFTVELNGVKLDAMIDTGSVVSVVAERAARKAGVPLDHPSSQNGGYAVGVGSERAAMRRAVFKTFTIGGEIIKEAELRVMRSDEAHAVDVLLGADFLRTHRVLFAMQQRLLYVNYLGGDVFPRESRTITVWLQREVDGGNAHAMLALAQRYAEGRLAPLDTAKAVALIERAASSGNRRAVLALAELRMRYKRPQEAVALYRSALAGRNDNLRSGLMLYLARLAAGEQAAGAEELSARLAADSKHAWPAQAGDYVLGRIDSAALRAAAVKDAGDLAADQACQAETFIGWLAMVRDGAEAPPGCN